LVFWANCSLWKHIRCILLVNNYFACCLGPSSSHSSWIYNYLCNQCLSPLKFWVRIPLRWGILDVALCHKVCQWLATGRLFSPVSPVSSINKTDRDDIAKILLKVVLNTKNPHPPFCLLVSISYLTKRVFVIVLYLFINDIVLLQYCINQYEALLSWRCIYYLSIHIKSTNSLITCVCVLSCLLYMVVSFQFVITIILNQIMYSCTMYVFWG